MDMTTNRNNSGRALAGGIALFALAWSAAGQAQDTVPAAEAEPEAQSSSGISDIIVTATRREERLQDVAVAVTAITGDSLSAADVSTVRSLTQVVPGFIGSRNMGVFQPVIRGVGSTGISIGDEPNIATYVDGVYQPESAANWIDLVEVERVEVLRGPQGTTFGRNATGGLINVITPDPSFDLRGKASLRYGRMRRDAGDYDARFYITGGLSDKLAADFAALYRKNDGYIDDLVHSGTLGDQEVINFRSKLLWQPSDNAKVILTGEFFDQNSTTNSPQPVNGNTAGRRFPGVILPTDAWQASLTSIPTLDLRRWSAALHVKLEFDGFNLEATSGFMNLRWYQETDSDASNIFLGNFPATFATESGSQEIKFTSADPGRFQWLLGGYFYQFGGHSGLDIVTSPGPGIPPTTLNLDPALSGRSFAGFAEGTYEIVDDLFITVGARYTTERRTFEQVVNGNLVVPKTAKSFNKFNYRGAVRYQFAPDGSIYASYGTAFKSGVYNMAGTSPNPVNPENIKAWEAGIKVDPFNWLRTNLAVYHYTYDDLQVQAKDASGPSYVLQNAASAKIYGGEFEAIIQPIDDLNIRGSAAYSHARYRDFPLAQSFFPRPDGGNTVAPADASGNVMTRAPKWTFNLGVDWGHEFDAGRLGVSVNTFYSTRLYYDFQNIFSQPSYTLTNASISFAPTGDRWKFSLWATNLTNEKVFQTIRVGAQATDGFYEQPRKVGVSAELRF